MRRIAIGLAATIGLALILFGMPALLIAVGPVGLPHVEPTLQGILQALLRPDDGTVFLTLVKVVGWVTWAILTVSVITEIIARLRHVHVPALPGLAIPQGFARGLVAAALTLYRLIAKRGRASRTLPRAFRKRRGSGSAIKFSTSNRRRSKPANSSSYSHGAGWA